MKNRFIYFSIILFAALVFNACEKDLDRFPLTQVSEDVFFERENDFKIFANQFYGWLPGFGTSSRDNFADIGNAGGHPVSNSNYVEDQGSGWATNWGGNYSQIRWATYLIERVQELDDASLKDQVLVYEAEARFFRAMAYFRLLRDYGGVPIVDKVLNLNDEDIIFGPRNSREEVTQFILNDLDIAAGLPLGSLGGGLDTGRVTKDAALAFKARVALFEGTWSKYHGTPGNTNAYLTQAIDAAAQVMNSGNHQLFDRRDVLGDDSYRYFFILESDAPSNPAGLGKTDQTEIILARKYDTELAGSGYISVNSGNLSPSKKMADMFLDNTGLPITHTSSVFQGYGFDIDPVTGLATNYEFIDRDPRMKSAFIEPFTQFWYHLPYDRDFGNPDLLNTGAFNDGFWTSATGYLLHKFLPEADVPGVDYPVIRLAEVLLIYAEALYERDDAIADADLDISINLLRDRVGMPHLTNGFVTANALNMQTEIRRERAVELYVEGFRFDDLRRWKTAEVEMSQDFKAIKFQGTPFASGPFDVFNPMVGSIGTVDNSLKGFNGFDADGFGIVDPSANRQFQEKHYLFPLPLGEITLNPQLEQNPGWLDGK